MEKCSGQTVVLSSCLLILWLLMLGACDAENCSSYSFSNGNSYANCNTLPFLNSLIHWNYHQNNHTVDIAYTHAAVTPSSWVVWSLNPGGGGMIGAQCLVALFNSTGAVHAYTSPISKYDTSMPQGSLSFGVPSLGAEFSNAYQMMIVYATIHLPAGATSFTHLWQDGPVSGYVPRKHSTSGDYMRSFGTIDFATGATTTAAPARSARTQKYVHGVVNVVSWGILMLLGAMAARYLKVFKSANPAWFYLHVACQVSGYVAGVGGWATGLNLGGDSEQTTHRNIGMALVALGTLQVSALLLRPRPEHKYRRYWNVYHHTIGYTVILLSIINIFKGLEILDSDIKIMWRTTSYIGVVVSLGVSAILLESFTWFVLLRRTRPSTSSSASHRHITPNGLHA